MALSYVYFKTLVFSLFAILAPLVGHAKHDNDVIIPKVQGSYFLAIGTSTSSTLARYDNMLVTVVFRSFLIAIFASLPPTFTVNHFVRVSEVFGSCLSTEFAHEPSTFSRNRKFTLLLVIFGLVVTVDASESATTTLHYVVDVLEIRCCLSCAVLTSHATANPRDHFVLVKDVGILLLPAMGTLQSLTFRRCRELMVVPVKPLLFLTVHAPPAFAFPFHPKMVLVTLFGSANFADSSSTGRLPNVFILK